MSQIPPAVRVMTTNSPGPHLWRQVLDLRMQVFGGEQGIIELTASDHDDLGAVHVLAILDEVGTQRVVGAGRVMLGHRQPNEALITWVMTDPRWRRKGIGTAVMQTLLHQADTQGIEETLLAAQTHAGSFYEELGFRPVGRPYEVSGIPHQWMSRSRPRRTGWPIPNPFA